MDDPLVAELPSWLEASLHAVLRNQRGHALLVQADAGVGALDFALTLAKAWLCEAGGGGLPCGRCAGCQLIDAHTHPDLRVCLPEALAVARGFPVELDSRRKPSRQIRIDEIRAAIDWSATTSARGRGKVALIHPAEAMNAASASALLKTLEEPAAGVRLILTTPDPALLMPTVVSRCQRLALPSPSRAEALAWLAGQGVAGAEVLLDATGGRPLTVRDWVRDGVSADDWVRLPAAVARGDASALAGWPPPRALDALQKIGHDSALLHWGAAPRFFPARSVLPARSLPALVRWQRSLQRVMQHADHPWSEGLLMEALVAEAAPVWQPGASGVSGASGASSAAERGRSGR